MLGILIISFTLLSLRIIPELSALLLDFFCLLRHESIEATLVAYV